MSNRTAILGAAVLFASLLACKQFAPKQEEADRGTLVPVGTAPPAETRGNVFTSKDQVSEVSKRPNWRVVTNLNSEAAIQLQTSDMTGFFIALTENHADLEISNLQKYSDVTRESLRESTQNYSDSERTELTINGMPALRYRISAVVDSTRINYYHVVIQGKTHYHQLLAWSLQSHFEGKRAEFEKLFSSYREKPSSSAGKARQPPQ